MRTRRSEGVGPVDTTIVAQIDKTDEKPIRRLTRRSRLAIVELPVNSESDDECSIGDLAPYNNEPRVSYHRRKIKKKSPSRSVKKTTSKVVHTRRSYSLRNRIDVDDDEEVETAEDEDGEESIDEESRKKARRPRETDVLKEAARECFGPIDLNVSLVDKVKERARRRQRQREEAAEKQAEEEEEDGDEEGDEEEEEDDDEDEQTEEDDNDGKGYSLRRNRAEPSRYGTLVGKKRVQVVKRTNRAPVALFSRSGASRRRRSSTRKEFSKPKRQKAGGSSSSSSSSSDEEHFQKKKSRQMDKARMTMLPLNLNEAEVNSRRGFRDRERIGASLADIDPMEFDKSITFESIGGHATAVKSLREMVVLPLLYPSVFDKFNVQAPRGVLFYGPPGTGKTLMARALVNECSRDGQKVAFFMRKGSDVLSKWVGESERQLRLLFDQAYRMRPSVIFFDEIDGLAPVRSSRQDHIHSSIVSTLLALMDGLDARGEVVIIGATNRIDSIDPALRRPGRFDRELLFTLPSVEARRDILRIHTAKWTPPPDQAFLSDLAIKTSGYCGADLKALCTESVLNSLQRAYPAVYRTQLKLKLDLDALSPARRDFDLAMKSIIPASVRSDTALAVPLAKELKPLLTDQFEGLINHIKRHWPRIQLKHDRLGTSSGLGCIFGQRQDCFSAQSTTFKPRLLITGAAENGQNHLARALLDSLDHLKLIQLTLASVYSCSTRTPEDALAEAVREASRAGGAVLFIPNIKAFWAGLTETARSVFVSIVNAIPASNETIILATTENEPFKALFTRPWKDTFNSELPSTNQRRAFFELIKQKCYTTVETYTAEAELMLKPVVAELPPGDAAKSDMSKTELKEVEQKEEATMRTLRIFLRNVVTRLAQDKRFKEFTKPVDVEEIPDYYDIVEHPMDLSIIMVNIDEHQYETVSDMLADIDLIVNNTLEYNPDNYHEERMIRHRACLLKDFAHEMVERELDPHFEKTCATIKTARGLRGAEKTKHAPQYMECEEDDEHEKQDDAEIAARPVPEADVVNEGDLCWAEQKDAFILCKVLKAHQEGFYSLQSLTTQRLLQEVTLDRMRATTDSDDINSILKSPCIKAQQRKKRRKRSSWASGVIKKTKRSSATPSRENEDEKDEEKDEEEVEEKTEQLSIEMTNETSNDSNKENQPQSPEITTTPVIDEQQQQASMEVATVENRPITPPPSPGKRVTRSSTKEPTTTPVKETAPKLKKHVRLEEPKTRQIPLEEIWTVDELQMARDELAKSTVIEINLDSDKLNTIFDAFTAKTDTWPVERIVELGCDLNAIIYTFRSVTDRQPLLVELEHVLSRIS